MRVDRGTGLGTLGTSCSALSVAEGGFSLHAATTAAADDAAGREALCKYVLRPPLAQERLHLLDYGLVRVELKRPFSDGTVAIDMDPLSLLCRLAAAVPPPKLHVIRAQARRSAGLGRGRSALRSLARVHIRAKLPRDARRVRDRQVAEEGEISCALASEASGRDKGPHAALALLVLGAALGMRRRRR